MEDFFGKHSNLVSTYASTFRNLPKFKYIKVNTKLKESLIEIAKRSYALPQAFFF